MATTIGALAYKVSADTKEFTEGMKATRRELAAGRQVMRETRTPAEKLAKKLDDLGNLYKKGAIDAETYARGVKKAKEEHKRLSQTTDSARGSLKGFFGGMLEGFRAIHPMVHTLQIGIQGITSAIGTVASGIGALGDKFSELNEAIKFQQLTGLTQKQFETIRFAAKNLGVDIDTTTDAIIEMEKRISDAALFDSGEGVGVLAKLGLDPVELNKLGGFDQFTKIAAALREIGNQRDRVHLADMLFGGEGQELMNLINAGEGAMRDAESAVLSFGAVLNRQQVRDIQEASKAFNEMSLASDGFFKQLQSVAAPVMSELFRSLAEILKQFTEFIQANPKLIENVLRDLASIIKDLAELMSSRGMETLNTMAEQGVVRGGLIEAAVSGRGFLPDIMGINSLIRSNHGERGEQTINHALRTGFRTTFNRLFGENGKEVKDQTKLQRQIEKNTRKQASNNIQLTSVARLA